MEETVHRDMPAERGHLRETVRYAKDFYDRISANDEDYYAGTTAGADAESDEILRILFAVTREQQLRWLLSAQSIPYFTRVDFSSARLGNTGRPASYYIGKFGLTDPGSGVPVVVDWRAPISDLYYSGDVGHTGFDAPDGYIEGNLTLKRRFEIQKGELNALYDSDIVAQEKFLETILNNQTTSRLKDIVSTIQKEQNAVIRSELHRNIIVQGVAGSGKTTIALHRVAYLLYKYQDTLKPESVMIFAPSSLFLNYIRDVLPDLGVENIVQKTYRNWCADLFEKADLTLKPGPGMVLPELTGAVGALAEFLNGYASYKYGFSDLTFRGRTVLTGTLMSDILNTGLKRDGLNVRLDAVREAIRSAMAAALSDLTEALNVRTIADIRTVRASDLTETEKKARIAALNFAFDDGVKALKTEAAQVTRTASRFTKPALAKVCRNFLDHLKSSGTLTACAHKAAVKALDAERYAELGLTVPVTILFYLEGEARMCDRTVRHIIIDEAQDYAPSDIALILRAYPAASFTFAGDIMQAILRENSISDWDDILCLPGVSAELRYLTVGYRSTYEICGMARDIAVRYTNAEHSFSNDFVRHGSEPVIRHLEKDQVRAFVRETAKRFAEMGLNSVAVITPDSGMNAEVVEWLNAGADGIGAFVLSDDYDGPLNGVMVADVVSAKGLEFDAVIIPDASASGYTGGYMDAKRYYVAITRALHRLAVGYTGEPGTIKNASITDS